MTTCEIERLLQRRTRKFDKIIVMHCSTWIRSVDADRDQVRIQAAEMEFKRYIVGN
jgi:hypothetical protein